ncbi:MAG: hypothetical protein AMXMBFR82_31470 [Candidatus Hydrogenedentota bacterium]
MSSHSLTLRQRLHEFSLARRRQIGKLAVVRVLWVSVAAALALVYLDVLLILPASARIGLAACSFFTLLVVAVATYWRLSRAVSEDRLVARLVEQGAPDLHNDVINAVDFDDLMAGTVRPGLSRDLMSHEIHLAADRVSAVRRVDTLRPPSLRGETRAFIALAIVLGTLAYLFSDVFAAVVPRFADPWGDHPPYSPTKFAVDPANSTVEYGENQIVRVTTSGKRPSQMALVLERPDGTIAGTLPMLDSGDGTYFQTIENVRTDLTYYAEIPRGRSKRYSLALSRIPRIDSVAVTYTYPEYTNLPSKSRLLSKTDATLVGYEGTQVRLDIASNRPLEGGPVTLGDQTLELHPGADEGTAAVEFPIEKASAITASLIDVEGFKSEDAFEGKIEVMPDKKPEIAIVSPGKHSFAIPDAKVPVMIEARDDLGIARIALVRNHNASSDDRKVLYEGGGSDIFMNANELLDMGDLGVRPGDVIEYYATATDTLPDSPQSASTPAFQIAIISHEDYRNFMQESTTAEDLKAKYEAIQQELKALAKEQQAINEELKALEQKLAESGSLSEEEQNRLEELRKQQEALAAKAGELAKKMQEEAERPAVFDIENEYKETLKELAERLGEAQKSMESSQQQMQPGASAEALQQAMQDQQAALDQLGQSDQQFQEQIQQANEDLAKIYKLLADVERFKQLYGAQQMLEREARTYKDEMSPSLDEQIRLKELSENQETIRESLERLRDDLREHAKEVETEYPQVAEDAQTIADSIESLQIPPTMASAAGNLAEPNAPQGHADAREALDAMESMIGFCQAAQGQGSSQCDLRLRIQMAMNPGNTLGQLQKSLGAPAMGQGTGQGQGGGMGSSSVPFDMYGNEPFGDPRQQESPFSSRRMHEAQAEPVPSDAFAGSFEELATSKSDDLNLEGVGGEHVVEEYRPLIEAYFRGLAEEES